MDTQMDQELAENKSSIWLKVAIAILVIATIGQISAVFLPALTGNAPKASTLIGSILWPGLLFMSIWALKHKRKIIGFFIGAIIGFILDFSAGTLAGYKQAEVNAIDVAVANSNKDLPKMIDEETRMDLASIDQKSKDYSLSFTLVNLLVSEIDIGILNDNFEQSIKPSTCGIQQFQLFFSEGYIINYVYKDKNGKFISQYSISPKECIKQ